MKNKFEKKLKRQWEKKQEKEAYERQRRLDEFMIDQRSFDQLKSVSEEEIKVVIFDSLSETEKEELKRNLDKSGIKISSLSGESIIVIGVGHA